MAWCPTLRQFGGDMGSVAVKEVRGQVTKCLECPTEEGIPEEHGLLQGLEEPLPLHPPSTHQPSESTGGISLHSLSPQGLFCKYKTHDSFTFSYQTFMLTGYNRNNCKMQESLVLRMSLIRMKDIKEYMIVQRPHKMSQSLRNSLRNSRTKSQARALLSLHLFLKIMLESLRIYDF